MSADAVQQCPYCREWIPLAATRCRFCREALPENEPRGREAADDEGDDDEEWEEERPRDFPEAEGAAAWLAPVRVTTKAAVAGYLGLFAWFPLLGGVCGPAAIVVGSLGLGELQRRPREHGRGRCWFGIVMGVLGTLLHVLFLAGWLLSQGGKR